MYRLITPRDLPTDPAERFLVLKGDPWAFLCTCVYTSDPKDTAEPIKKAPVNKEYIYHLTQEWINNKYLIIDKSRQMWCSWLYTALYLHDTIAYLERRNFFVSKKLEDADKLVERAHKIYQNIPTDIWPEAYLPKARRKENYLIFDDLDSQIQALASGEDQMRGHVASGVFNDEFAFWDLAEETLAAQQPSSQRITIISTNPESYGDVTPYFYKVIDDEST